MIELRFHGRGGQKLALWAEVLALAALKDSRYTQTHASFRAEEPGAPAVAMCRIDCQPIRSRATNRMEADHAVVMDASVLPLVNVSEGLRSGGTVFLPAGAAFSGPAGAGLRVQQVDTAGLGPEEARAVILRTVATATLAASQESVLAALKETGLYGSQEHISES